MLRIRNEKIAKKRLVGINAVNNTNLYTVESCEAPRNMSFDSICDNDQKHNCRITWTLSCQAFLVS